MSQLIKKRFDLRALLDEVIKEQELSADNIGAKIKLYCPDKLPIKADYEQLKRVFLNLISNSIYWLETDTKGGRRDISISVEQQNGKVILEFKDEGPGISPEHINQVFDYFHTTKGDRGMGFGLAIAKRIVEAHGGNIQAKSRWGFHTIIRIELPCLDR